MKNQSLLIILSLATGIMIPIQATFNAACSKVTGNPITAALIALLVGSISITIYILLSKTNFPEVSQLKGAHPMVFAGGMIVAFYLVIITYILPRLGVGSSIGLIITGQLIGAVIIDHYGLFDTAVRTMDLKRVVGTFFMVIGIYLVMKK